MAESYDPGAAPEQPSDDSEQRRRVTADMPPCHCVICEPSAGEDQGWFAEASAHVKKTGWTSIGIMPGTKTPGWAFSVGLWHSYRTAEVSIFGLLLPDMQQRVNRAGRLIRDNKPFGLDIEIDGVLDAQPVIAKQVHPAWYATLFGFGVGFYRGAVPPFVQLVWPDSHGVFPWQPGCGTRCLRAQPQLWLPPELHPPGPWQNPE